MSESAPSRDSVLAAAEAVKAYIRMNRASLASDSELLALLLPERYAAGDVADMQKFLLERLRADNAELRAERDALLANRQASRSLGEGVRRLILDLLDARSFEEAIAVATASSSAFAADKAAFCVESLDGASPTGTRGVRLIAPGTTEQVLGQASGAVLANGGELLLGASGAECRSLAVFRLRIGRDTPAALFVLGAFEPGRFEGDETAADLTYFARALERTIRAWLDLPKG